MTDERNRPGSDQEPVTVTPGDAPPPADSGVEQGRRRGSEHGLVLTREHVQRAVGVLFDAAVRRLPFLSRLNTKHPFIRDVSLFAGGAAFMDWLRSL